MSLLNCVYPEAEINQNKIYLIDMHPIQHMSYAGKEFNNFLECVSYLIFSRYMLIILYLTLL